LHDHFYSISVLKRALVLKAAFAFGILAALVGQSVLARPALEMTRLAGQFHRVSDPLPNQSTGVALDDSPQHRRPVIVRRAPLSKLDPSAAKLGPSTSKLDPNIRNEIARKHSGQCKSLELSRRLEARRSALRSEQQSSMRGQRR
jgi:hypothetical protein